MAQYDPRTDDNKIGKLNKYNANEIAKLISLHITGAPGDKYTYGTTQNLIESPWKLRDMIDWIIKDYNNECNNCMRLNLTYINQSNMEKLHRAGWEFCVEYLQSLQSNTGVLFDLYTDRTFQWANLALKSYGIIPYTSPWIGFVHHCPNSEYTENNIDNMINNPLFIQSLPMCKGIITLSTYLKKYLEQKLDKYNIPIINMYHPTQFIVSNDCFTIEKFVTNDNRMLINIGGWYRNTTTIYHLDVTTIRTNMFQTLDIKKGMLKGKNMNAYFPPDNLSIIGGYILDDNNNKIFKFKIMEYDNKCSNESSIISGELLSNSNKWIYYMEKYINENMMLITHFDLTLDDIPENFKFGLNEVVSENNAYVCSLHKYFKHILQSVNIINYLPDQQYDGLLSENIVFLDLLDCSAVNTIIECIVRNVPLIVNRHEAIEEYLGKDYPLFYDNYDDIYKLLKLKKITLAHNYLKNMDKEFLRIEYFIKSLKDSTIYKTLNN